MKKILALALLAFSLGMVCGFESCDQSQAATGTASWSFDYSKDPPCSQTVTINCISGFQIIDITVPNSPVVVATIPTPANANGPTTVSATVTLTTYGNRSFVVSATEVTATGPIQGAPSNTVTINIQANAPTNFVVTPA